MIVIRTLEGHDVDIDPDAVLRIAGPRPGDVGPHTYVDGPGTLVTAETTPALLGRLGLVPPLLQLTRPDGTPVWVKVAAIVTIRAPLPTEQQGAGEVNAVLIIGGLHQSVHETPEKVEALVKARGKPA